MVQIHAKQRVDSHIEHINEIDARTISNIATMHVLHTLDYTPEEIETLLSTEAEILRHFHYARSDSENIHSLGRFIKNNDYILKQCNKNFISSSIESTEQDRGALAANLKNTFSSLKKAAERIRKRHELARMRQPRNIHYFSTIRDLRSTWHITFNTRQKKEDNYSVPPMFIDMRQGSVGIKLAPLVPITLPCDEQGGPYQCSVQRLAIKMRSSVVSGAFAAIYREAQQSKIQRVLIQSEEQISIIHDEGLFTLRKSCIELADNELDSPIWSIGAEKTQKIPNFEEAPRQKIFGAINPRPQVNYDYDESSAKEIDSIYNEILAYEESIRLAKQNVFLIETSSPRLSHRRVTYQILKIFASNYYLTEKSAFYSSAPILTYLIDLIDHIYTIENEIASHQEVSKVLIDYDSNQSIIYLNNSENMIIIDKTAVFEVSDTVKKDRPAISIFN